MNNINPEDKEILKHLADGKTVKQIAPEVCKSPHTVNYHIRKILRSLNAKNTTEAVAYAIRNNFI